MKVVVFGQNGGLARSVQDAFAYANWSVRAVGRFDPTPMQRADAYVFTQGVFLRKPFIECSAEELDEVIDVGLTRVVERLHDCLSIKVDKTRRVDYVLIGSTSSYQGFANSAAYCATKFALRGLVQSLNAEYVDTNTRFWLFSMGTMDTAMGRQLTDQDAFTFLSPDDVGERIVSAITSPSNMFEPEVVIRRRVVR